MFFLGFKGLLSNLGITLSKYINNPLSITYSDNTSHISSNDTESFTPGSTFSKTMTVTNNTNRAFDFKMSLEDVVNTFTRKE